MSKVFRITPKRIKRANGNGADNDNHIQHRIIHQLPCFITGKPKSKRNICT